LQNEKQDIYVILDNIRSMHNVGAIFRTCDAAGVKQVFLCGITATPPRPQISKTALNTINHVSWKYYKSTLRIVNRLKDMGVMVIGLEQTDRSINFKNFNYQTPIAIILGNEVDGISKKVLEQCHAHVEIPMRGVAKSLNVSTACGIALFQMLE
jgi:tRNA G18 (ribose-2'-O)-methylase SpoU